jgi:hypothetical protein
MRVSGLRRTRLSLAAFVLICFFLPWVQLSCVGMKDQVSGFDLAREGDAFLWFIPASMLVILALGLMKFGVTRSSVLDAFSGAVCGGLSAYLMYHERSSVNGAPRMVATQWSALFWLSFAACLGIAATSILTYSERSRSP